MWWVHEVIGHKNNATWIQYFCVLYKLGISRLNMQQIANINYN